MNSAQRRRERRIQEERLERQALLQRTPPNRTKAQALAERKSVALIPTPKIEIDFSKAISDAFMKSISQSFAPSWTFRVGEVEPKPPAVDSAKLSVLKGIEPYRVAQRVPDMVHVITAWRAWRTIYTADGLRLKALGQEDVWQPRKMISAVCQGGGRLLLRFGSGATPSASHAAPQQTCGCGVWAFKELDSLVQAVDSYSDIKVLGQVSLWGRVIETENGYRAQYAYPSELWLFDKSLEELGLIYDVPVRCVD